MTSNSHHGRGGHDSVDTAVWRDAEEHILGRVISLTRWDAERWAVAHERKQAEVASMAERVSYLEASGGSDSCTYLAAAFTRIDAAVAELDWANSSEDDTDLAGALGETIAAVKAVARHALSTVVFAEHYEPSTA